MQRAFSQGKMGQKKVISVVSSPRRTDNAKRLSGISILKSGDFLITSSNKKHEIATSRLLIAVSTRN